MSCDVNLISQFGLEQTPTGHCGSFRSEHPYRTEGMWIIYITERQMHKHHDGIQAGLVCYIGMFSCYAWQCKYITSFL
jgi:hypothetical protein